jgi:hypothetical protein
MLFNRRLSSPTMMVISFLLWVCLHASPGLAFTLWPTTPPPAAPTIDPLTKEIMKLEFCPLYPALSKIQIGDVYRDFGLKDAECLANNLPDQRSKNKLKLIMDRTKNEAVTLANYSEEAKFSLEAGVDILGRISAALSANGAKHFTLKWTGLKLYCADRRMMAAEIIPEIKRACQPQNLIGRLVVYKLLQVDSLEYTCLDKKGAAIKISNQGELANIVKARLGADWSISSEGTIKINNPLFIGFIAVEVTKDSLSYITPQMAATGATTASSRTTSLTTTARPYFQRTRSVALAIPTAATPTAAASAAQVPPEPSSVSATEASGRWEGSIELREVDGSELRKLLFEQTK